MRHRRKKKKKGSSCLGVTIINIPIATNAFISNYERVGTPANMSTFLHFWLQFTPSNRFQSIPNMTLLWGFSLSVPTQTQPSADQMDIYSWMFLLFLVVVCAVRWLFFQPTSLFGQPVVNHQLGSSSDWGSTFRLNVLELRSLTVICLWQCTGCSVTAMS